MIMISHSKIVLTALVTTCIYFVENRLHEGLKIMKETLIFPTMWKIPFKSVDYFINATLDPENGWSHDMYLIFFSLFVRLFTALLRSLLAFL